MPLLLDANRSSAARHNANSWRIVGGALSLTFGFLGLYLVILFAVEITSWVSTAPFFLLAGFGLGTAVSPLFQVALSGTHGADAGSASGAIQALQQLGVSFGVAIMGGLFFANLGPALPGDMAAYGAAARSAFWYSMAATTLIALWTLIHPPRDRLRET